jgi:hypothetical protein
MVWYRLELLSAGAFTVRSLLVGSGVFLLYSNGRRTDSLMLGYFA